MFWIYKILTPLNYFRKSIFKDSLSGYFLSPIQIRRFRKLEDVSHSVLFTNSFFFHRQIGVLVRECKIWFLLLGMYNLFFNYPTIIIKIYNYISMCHKLIYTFPCVSRLLTVFHLLWHLYTPAPQVQAKVKQTISFSICFIFEIIIIFKK